MKKIFYYVLLMFFKINAFSQDIKQTNTWIIEFNDNIPATYREESGKIQMYFVVLGMVELAEVHEFMKEMQMFRFVQSITIYDNNSYGTIFHTILNPNTTFAQIQKMFISLEIRQTIFFDKIYDIDLMPLDLIQEKFSL